MNNFITVFQGPPDLFRLSEEAEEVSNMPAALQGHRIEEHVCWTDYQSCRVSSRRTMRKRTKIMGVKNQSCRVYHIDIMICVSINYDWTRYQNVHRGEVTLEILFCWLIILGTIFITVFQGPPDLYRLSEEAEEVSNMPAALQGHCTDEHVCWIDYQRCRVSSRRSMRKRTKIMGVKSQSCRVHHIDLMICEWINYDWTFGK